MSQIIPTARLGKSALQVARLGLGAAPIGNLYSTVTDAQAVATVQYALEHGMPFFDTAPLYGAGNSERRVGMALAGVARERYVLATKVGRLITPEGAVTFDYSRDGVLRSVESSLQRLQLERIDILHIHDPDNHAREALEEAFPTLAELRSQGVIGAIGAGMNQWQVLMEFARSADFDCFLLAGRYTLLEQNSLEFLSLCQAREIGIILGGVYNSGILATGPQPGAKYQYTEAPPEILDRARQIEAICHRHRVPLHVAAVHFAQAHPAVTALVIGAESPQEVAANRQAWQTPVPAALWTELRQTGLIHAKAPVPTSP